MLRVADLAEDLKTEGEAGFLAAYPHPFLLIPHDHSKKGFVTYHTRMTSRDPAQDVAKEFDQIKNYQVLLPNLSKQNPPGLKFTIGRDPSREFLVEHSTVSKRHAYLVYDEFKKAYKLGDAGSTNGTAIEGAMIEAGEAILLRDGLLISFGDCDYVYFSPNGMLQVLKRISFEAKSSP